MSDDHDYAHMHDPQSQRARRELWVILAVVIVVIGGALIWRSVDHVPAKPQKGWGPHNELVPANEAAPGAAAGVHAASPPPPRPLPTAP